MQHDGDMSADGGPDEEVREVRPTNPAPSRLRRTLHRLSSPFRTASHLERTGSARSSASESEVTRDRVRKRNKKAKASKSDDGSPGERKKERTGFVRRFGSIGRKRGEGSLAASSETSTQSSIARDMEEPGGAEDPQPDNVEDDISAEHAVATKPFTKAAWRRNEGPVIERPVEEPSPESAVKRRIAFVAQASACLSEDAGGSHMSLQEAVTVARVSLIAPHSRSPSLRSRDNETEEEGFAEAMPPYGDLIEAPSTSGTHASAPSNERREHLYKILVIGELGTGKTSIIKRYVHQFFSQHYRATIGVDFALKVLNWDSNTIIRLQLWDIAGQERFGNMTRVYYKEAVGAFIVFDVTRVATFDAVVKWKNDLDAKVQLPDGSAIPCVLLANKCDQQKEGIVNTPAKMDEFCKEKGFAGWFETSAKENINIEEAARSLVNKILLNDKLLQSDVKDGEKFALDHKIANGENTSDGTNKSCNC